MNLEGKGDARETKRLLCQKGLIKVNNNESFLLDHKNQQSLILTPYSKSTSMNYPINHFSMHLYNFLMSYGCFEICATCTIY